MVTPPPQDAGADTDLPSVPADGAGAGQMNRITQAKMGVVIQRMIEPVSSGVLFTVDPRAVEQTTHMLVEAVHGLGDGIVSGEITPHSFSVDIATCVITAQNRTVQKVKVGRNPDKKLGGISTLPTTGREKTTSPITDDELLALCAAGRAVSTHYGTPQDLEWCTLFFFLPVFFFFFA